MDAISAILAQDSGFSWDRLFDKQVFIFFVGGAIAICAIVSVQLRKYHETKQLNQLKADLIARGFAADEIARVVEAGPDRPSPGKS